MIINKKCFDEMVTENIKWINQYPQTLESNHAIGIMKEFSELFYSKSEQIDKVLKFIHPLTSENITDKNIIDLYIMVEKLKKSLVVEGE